jgi:hypothetical protein
MVQSPIAFNRLHGCPPFIGNNGGYLWMNLERKDKYHKQYKQPFDGKMNTHIESEIKKCLKLWRKK